ncbi:hypothetical protein DFA_02680 [Cavenderia fasciculata]|uniref:Uncharacterized protein n=1 Tax=Cavenderia fasciculata TaxID=261658 RepID=F4Q026_CACFS|nr:uncharacterized protein DFA_02680 [Cavenderia fasciculata]EGG18940.1 hypothetical protein DFA_02680 [Cavenderia fasciculata]|eukprot:XP_004357402.1 hypothetical protein DFA_02680 [Cavenderia fasciculata]
MSLTKNDIMDLIGDMYPGYPGGHNIEDIMDQIDNGTYKPPTIPDTSVTPPVKPPTTTPPPVKPPVITFPPKIPPKTVKENRFYVGYSSKSDEVFNDEKRPVPPLPVAKPPAPGSKAAAAVRSKREVEQDLLPAWDPDYVIPPFDPDRKLTDEEGLKIILHMSVFEGSKNVVSQNADNYFLENMLHYSDPNNEILELFGLTKPKLNQKRLDICDEPKVTLWYSYYSFYYLPLIVANGNYSVSKKIDNKFCQEKLHNLETNPTFDNTYAHQRMLLFKFAFCEKNQWMQKFQKNAVRWLPLYMAALKDRTNLPKTIYDLNNKRSQEQFQAYIVNAKAVLDIFDPTGETSKNTINTIIGASIFINLDKQNSIKDTKLNRDIIKDTIERIIEKAKSGVDEPDVDQDTLTIYKDILAVTGSTVGSVREIQKAILATQFESIDGPNLDKGYEQYFKDRGARIMNKMQVTASNTNQIAKAFGYIFKVCQISVIIYSIVNWDKLDTYNKTFFALDVINIGLDLASSSTEVVPNAFRSLGSVIGVGLNKLPAADKILTVMENVFTTDLASFVATRFSPGLMAISAIKSVYDCVQDAKVGNIGAMVLDGVSAGIGLGVAMAIFGGCACAGILFLSFFLSILGPLALLAGGVLLALAGIKYIFFSPSNDQIFYDKLYKDFKLN